MDRCHQQAAQAERLNPGAHEHEAVCPPHHAQMYQDAYPPPPPREAYAPPPPAGVGLDLGIINFGFTPDGSFKVGTDLPFVGGEISVGRETGVRGGVDLGPLGNAQVNAGVEAGPYGLKAGAGARAQVLDGLAGGVVGADTQLDGRGLHVGADAGADALYGTAGGAAGADSDFGVRNDVRAHGRGYAGPVDAGGRGRVFVTPYDAGVVAGIGVRAYDPRD